MESEPGWQEETAAVRLFPLPNVVLFPRAVLPLHIFEERYKAMTAHSISTDHAIAMALLKPGWEKAYYGTPSVEPVVCVGRILSCERLPDGRYNFLLQGQHRARIVREFSGQPYRQADVQIARLSPALEIDLEHLRNGLHEALMCGGARSPLVGQFEQIFSSPLPTAAVADLVAFTFLEDVPANPTSPLRDLKRPWQ